MRVCIRVFSSKDIDLITMLAPQEHCQQTMSRIPSLSGVPHEEITLINIITQISLAKAIDPNVSSSITLYNTYKYIYICVKHVDCKK